MPLQKSTLNALAQVIADALASRPELIKAIVKELSQPTKTKASRRTAAMRKEEVRARFNRKAIKESSK